MSVKAHSSTAAEAANKSFVATVKIVALVLAWYGVNIGRSDLWVCKGVHFASLAIADPNKTASQAVLTNSACVIRTEALKRLPSALGCCGNAPVQNLHRPKLECYQPQWRRWELPVLESLNEQLRLGLARPGLARSESGAIPPLGSKLGAPPGPQPRARTCTGMCLDGVLQEACIYLQQQGTVCSGPAPE